MQLIYYALYACLFYACYMAWTHSNTEANAPWIIVAFLFYVISEMLEIIQDTYSDNGGEE